MDRNSRPGLAVSRRFWVDLLGKCRIHEVTDGQLDEAIAKLWRLPKFHGKKYRNYESVDQLIEVPLDF